MADGQGDGLTVGLVGATGLVGSAILRVMEETRFPVSELRLWAGRRSAGSWVSFRGKRHPVRQIGPGVFQGCRLVFFAGTEGEKGASRIYGPEAIEAGAVVIDNGSDFRMEPWVPLVVPEVNPHDLKRHRGLVANPNCSTIQMVVALAPIHRRFGLKRVVVSTYQSVSGAGRKGLEALEYENQKPKSKYRRTLFSRRIAGDVVPQIGEFGDSGYTAEEWKMLRETRKILHDPRIAVNATTVRVPVAVGHAESVYFETRGKATIGQLEKLLSRAPGVVYSKNGYHTPAEIAGRDQVFVSRLRADSLSPRAFTLWCAADNLRKGAAANAVQIAALLYKNRLIPERAGP
jgi:aspartate-semialdehyde dehydrogenase